MFIPGKHRSDLGVNLKLKLKFKVNRQIKDESVTIFFKNLQNVLFL